MKKQLLRLALLLMMLVGIMATTAFAADPLTLTVSNETAMPGEEVTVTISVANNTGLASLQFDVAYDEVLTLTGVTFDSAFGSMVTAPEPYRNPEPLTMISPLSDITANGLFATLTFTVAEDAEPGYKANITLSYNEDDIYDGSYNNVPVSVVNGSVTVGGSPAVTLAAPKLTVSNNVTTGKPVLTWTAVEKAEKYEVWRATSQNGEYTLLTSTTELKLINASVNAGETFYYKVRAVAGTSKGEFSKALGRTCDLERPVATASNNITNGKIVLTWEAVPGATKYEVWRSATKDGTYEKIYTTTGLKLTNSSVPAGETYYYKVRAICGANANGNSAYSVPVGRTCDLARPVVTVTNNVTTGKIVLTWKAVTGADRYEVWRSTTKDGTYTKIYTTTGLKLTNSSVPAGETYYYKVKAICDDNANGNSAYSAPVGRTCDLARPVVTITLNSKGKPVLTWKAVTGAVKYEIYRATSEDGIYTKIYTTTGLKLTNSSAVSGVTYYYKVRAICEVAAGNSAYSVPQAVTVG